MGYCVESARELAFKVSQTLINKMKKVREVELEE